LERYKGSGDDIAIHIKYGAVNVPDLRIGSRNILSHRRQHGHEANQELAFPQHHYIPHYMEERKWNAKSLVR
jgi:hypothetical protein